MILMIGRDLVRDELCTRDISVCVVRESTPSTRWRKSSMGSNEMKRHEPSKTSSLLQSVRSDTVILKHYISWYHESVARIGCMSKALWVALQPSSFAQLSLRSLLVSP